MIHAGVVPGRQKQTGKALLDWACRMNLHWSSKVQEQQKLTQLQQVK
jgi:hypothetical protein